jgi:putative SOS response-associated peptidase YedK
MLTVNADQHPVMKRFHKVGDEKRTPVIVSEPNYMDWLDASIEQASQLMHVPMPQDLMAV